MSAATTTITSLRFNQPESRAITLSSTSTLAVGGILVSATAGDSTISGGSLKGNGSGELVFIQNSVNDLTVNSSVTVSAVTKGGAGTVVLAGNNTYPGTTYVAEGTLAISGSNTGTGRFNIADGATLRLVATANNLSSGTAAVTGNSLIAPSFGSTLQLRADDDTAFVGNFNGYAFPAAQSTSAVVGMFNFDVDRANSGSGAQNKTLRLTTANIAFPSSSGWEQINITGGNGYSLGIGNVTLPAGTLNLNPTTGNLLTTGTLSNQVNGPATLVFMGSGTSVIAGPITAVTDSATSTRAINLTFNQSGTVLLSASNALNVLKSNSTSNSAAVNINNGTTVLNNSFALASGTGAVANTVNLGDTTGTNSAKLLLGGGVGNISGGVSVDNAMTVRNGSTSNTLTLGGQNTSGLNTFSGNITLGGGNNAPKDLTLVAATGGEVDFNGNILKAGTGTGAIVTIGSAGNAGTVKLAGNNTYAGATNVIAGKLILTGSIAGTAIVNGDANTTISGNGLAPLAVTVTAGRIAPGVNVSGTNSNFGAADTIRLGTSGGLSLSNAKLDFDLASTAAGTSDKILTGGALSLSSSTAFTFNTLTAGVVQTGVPYTLISGATNNSGFDAAALTANTTFIGTSFDATYAMSGNDLQVTFLVIPEPGTFGTVIGGIGLLLASQRMRRRPSRN